jgi:hypothetical protein
MKQVRVVDPEDLVLEECCVHFAIFLLASSGLRPLGLIPALVILAMINCLLGLVRVLCFGSKDLNLGAEFHGGILIESSLTNKSIAPLITLKHLSNDIFET